jgi:hypothetical protein
VYHGRNWCPTASIGRRIGSFLKTKVNGMAA